MTKKWTELARAAHCFWTGAHQIWEARFRIPCTPPYLKKRGICKVKEKFRIMCLQKSNCSRKWLYLLVGISGKYFEWPEVVLQFFVNSKLAHWHTQSLMMKKRTCKGFREMSSKSSCTRPAWALSSLGGGAGEATYIERISGLFESFGMDVTGQHAPAPLLQVPFAGMLCSARHRSCSSFSLILMITKGMLHFCPEQHVAMKVAVKFRAEVCISAGKKTSFTFFIVWSKWVSSFFNCSSLSFSPKMKVKIAITNCWKIMSPEEK